MFGTRRTGNVYTSVPQHPFKILILAVAMLTIGFAMVGSATLWIIPGVLVLVLGFWVGCIGARQAWRALRIIFS
jgi:hypothetical protein